MARAIDIVGHRFGMLTVLNRADYSDDGRRPWTCRCDCGNTKDVHTDHLRRGVVRSCGCMVRALRGPRKDLTGLRFGRLVIVGMDDTRNANGRIMWHYQCDCGNTGKVAGEFLKNRPTASCGCARGTHRHTTMAGKSPTYASWQSMMARCYYPSNPAHAYYKSLGIEVCERWKTFSNFLADMGERPSKDHTLDRHPNKTGNYEPGNCRWATKKEQANNRVTNRSLEYKGQKYTLSELCAATGLAKDFLHSRLRHGWDVTAAVETPKIPARYYPRKKVS